MPKITLKTEVESLDDVPEAYRGSYAETDGKFRLGEIEIDDAAEVKTALERARADRKKAKEEAEALRAEIEKYKDIDPDKAREALQQLQDAEERKLQEAGNFEKLQEKWRQQKAKELSERDTNIQALESELRKFKLDDRVRTAALNAGVLADDINDVLKLTAKYFQLDDKGEIVVLDGDGDATYSTVEDFFTTTYKEQRPKYYAPTGAGISGSLGGGSGGGSGSGSDKKTMTRGDFQKLDPAERYSVLKEGISIVDGPTANYRGRDKTKKQVKRSAFDQMTPQDRAAFVSEGGVVVA